METPAIGVTSGTNDARANHARRMDCHDKAGPAMADATRFLSFRPEILRRRQDLMGSIAAQAGIYFSVLATVYVSGLRDYVPIQESEDPFFRKTYGIGVLAGDYVRRDAANADAVQALKKTL